MVTESLGTYSSPNRKCVSETRVGYRVGQGFISSCFSNSTGKAYRLWYTYFSNLVARTRLLLVPMCSLVCLVTLFLLLLLHAGKDYA